MANHVRQQLRERAATTVTSLTTTGARVFQGRVYPLTQAEMPGLLVYTNDEVVDGRTLSPPRTLDRRVQLVVEGRARGADVEDVLDTIAKEVEVAVYNDRTLNSLARDTALQRTEVTLTGQGDQAHGSVRLAFEVTYMARENAPDVAT